MKKLFLFVAAAAAFAACSETDVLDQAVVNQQAIENDGAVKFDVYAQRGITRGGGWTGDLTNKNIGKNGFGVFAFYTDNEKYSSSAKPNFMYNQKVWLEGDAEATFGSLWKYEPVKYWPNEYGNAAVSDAIDYVTFFSYAPWTQVEPTTGKIVVNQDSLTAFVNRAIAANPSANQDSLEQVYIKNQQTKNIISVNSNGTQGDPIVKYVVDTDPGTSVDLLWGVAAQQADSLYTPIDGKLGSEKANADVEIVPGLPFVDLVKPNNPASDRLVFNLKHALAKVKFTIDYIADQPTPLEGTYFGANKYGADTVPNPLSKEIDAQKTRIFVRSFSIDGWALEGALNLRNTEAGVPLWKDIDGSKDLSFNTITFLDGLKDGKEGTANNIQKSETPVGLNPTIIENYCITDTLHGTAADKYAGDSIIFGKEKNLGVPCTTDSVLLFGGASANDGYFYVIPRNADEDVNVKIVYDVQTIDQNLAGLLADGVTHGSIVENVISKEAIFGQGVDFQPGYQYWIKIHIGMTSVKIEATVEPWIETGNTIVNLPDNQNPDINVPNSIIPAAGTTYNFTSWSDAGKTVKYGEGTVETTGNFYGSLVEVEVKTNNATDPNAPDFTGKLFYVPATATGTDPVQLIEKDADGNFKNTGIFVTF